MATPFPHHYTVELDGTGPFTIGAGPRPEIVGGPPPEFDGRDSWWSPEHLLLASAALCLAATFRAIAARARLDVTFYRTTARGTLDRTPDGARFTSITLAVDLEVPEADRGRAAELLRKAKQHCIVANSLAAPVVLEIGALVPA